MTYKRLTGMPYRKLPEKTGATGGKFFGVNLDIPGNSEETERGFLQCMKQVTSGQQDIVKTLTSRNDSKN